MNTNIAPNVRVSFKAYRDRNVNTPVTNKDAGLLRKPESKEKNNNMQDAPLRSVEAICKIIEAKRMELSND
tara:strand:+ start:935 stop:1147 length:213 start_codon:yes stop_codon:yes gene_type:complete